MNTGQKKQLDILIQRLAPRFERVAAAGIATGLRSLLSGFKKRFRGTPEEVGAALDVLDGLSAEEVRAFRKRAGARASKVEALVLELGPKTVLKLAGRSKAGGLKGVESKRAQSYETVNPCSAEAAIAAARAGEPPEPSDSGFLPLCKYYAMEAKEALGPDARDILRRRLIDARLLISSDY